jgi:hypothetical protein
MGPVTLEELIDLPGAFTMTAPQFRKRLLFKLPPLWSLASGVACQSPKINYQWVKKELVALHEGACKLGLHPDDGFSTPLVVRKIDQASPRDVDVGQLDDVDNTSAARCSDGSYLTQLTAGRVRVGSTTLF